MIRLQIIDDSCQHFVVSGTEPFRVEQRLINSSTRSIMFVYPGVMPDQEQDPCLVYDGCDVNPRSGIVLSPFDLWEFRRLSPPHRFSNADREQVRNGYGLSPSDMATIVRRVAEYDRTDKPLTITFPLESTASENNSS